MFDCFDRGTPQAIGHLVGQGPRFVGSSLPGDAGCTIHKPVDIQLTAASVLKMPLMQSRGLVANPGVAEVRTGCDGDPVHGRLKSEVPC